MLKHPLGELRNLPDLLTLPAGESAHLPQRLHQILQAAALLFQADRYSLVPFNPETRIALETVTFRGPDLGDGVARADGRRADGVARRILALESRSVFVDDLEVQPELQEPFTREGGVRASAAVTLTTRPSDVPLAVLYLDYHQPRTFTPEEQAQLRYFASQASLALQQTWLLHRYAEVTRLGQAINSELTTVRHLFEGLHTGIAPLLDCSYFFLLALYEREYDTLTLYYAERGERQILEQESLEGACRWVITNQQPLLIRHFSAEQPGLPVAPIPIPGTGQREESLIFVPLLFRDRALGVLSVQHPEPDFYDDEDLQVLQLLGNQVALALNTIQLFDSLTQLNTTGRALVQELNLGPAGLAQRVADLIRETARADVVSLYATDQAQLSPYPVVSGQLRSPDHPRSNPRRGDDIALLALEHTTLAFLSDSAQLYEVVGGDPALRRGGFAEREQIKSTAVLALRVGAEIVGVLFVNYRQAQRFDAFQRQLIESLASYAAIAIRNAGRYDTVIRNRITELEALQQIDHALSRSLDLAKVMETIIRFAQERTHADEASVVLLNEATGRLECQASVGANAAYRRTWSTAPHEQRDIISWAFNHRATARVGDVHREQPWSELYFQVDARVNAEMDVPLVTPEGVAVGVINLESLRPDAFGPEEQHFIETLAGQAVLALKNAQAYEREQRLALESKALVEIGAEIVRQLQPEEVFARILGQALKLTRVPVGTLHLYDEASGRLQMVAQQGLSPDHQERAARLELGQGVLGVAARERRLIRVDDIEDPYWRAIHLPYIPDVRSALAVPLIEGDRLRGVLNLESTELRHFTDRDARLLLGFADLAIIALQNAERYAEAERQRQRAAQGEDRFRLLYDAGRRLTAVTDERDAYAVVARIAHEHFHCHVAGLRFSPAAGQLVPIVEVGNRPEYPAVALSIDVSLNGQAARERRTIVVDDIGSMPPGLAQVRGSDPETRSLIAAPVVFERAYYGNLNFSHSAVGYFEHDDVQLIEGLAQQLGNTLHRLEITAARQEAQQRVREAEAMTTIGQAAYELAHRLGNDLGPITPSINKIRAELHRLNVHSELIEHMLEQITHDKNQVVRLVKRLKDDLAKDSLIGGRSPSQERPQASALLVRELLEVTAATNTSLPQNVRVMIECDETVSQVKADYRQVTDLLRNLFLNAVEAMTPDGGTVVLRARNDGALVTIEVADTGPGIADSRIGRIFDLFYSTKPEGTGFGLWSARRNALANGGELVVVSQLGAGATFRLSLPRVEEPAEGAI